MTLFSTRVILLLMDMVDDALTARQTLILKSLIEEYLDTAEPVGSETLDRKYNLNVSSATIRNEMVQLTKKGFLRQPHTSAGRLPTPKALRFYITQLMQEKELSLAEEVKVKEEIMNVRDNLYDLLDEATHILAEKTRSLAIATLSDEEKVWHAGYSNVFLNPEFADFNVTFNVFSCLEKIDMLQDLFFRKMPGESLIEVVFGEDLDWPGFDVIGVVGTHFVVKDKKGALGVIGPARLPYAMVIPTLRYFKTLIEEVGKL